MEGRGGERLPEGADVDNAWTECTAVAEVGTAVAEQSSSQEGIDGPVAGLDARDALFALGPGSPGGGSAAAGLTRATTTSKVAVPVATAWRPLPSGPVAPPTDVAE